MNGLNVINEAYPLTQCAAVSRCLLVIKVAPQFNSPPLPSPAIQGNSWTFVIFPPTTRICLLLTPHTRIKQKHFFLFPIENLTARSYLRSSLTTVAVVDVVSLSLQTLRKNKLVSNLYGCEKSYLERHSANIHHNETYHCNYNEVHS